MCRIAWCSFGITKLLSSRLAWPLLGQQRRAWVSVNRPWCFFDLMMTDIMATESTEKHGNNEKPFEFFPCLSVDSVAINKNTGTQLVLSASVIIKLTRSTRPAGGALSRGKQVAY